MNTWINMVMEPEAKGRAKRAWWADGEMGVEIIADYKGHDEILAMDITIEQARALYAHLGAILRGVDKGE